MIPPAVSLERTPEACRKSERDIIVHFQQSQSSAEAGKHPGGHRVSLRETIPSITRPGPAPLEAA